MQESLPFNLLNCWQQPWLSWRFDLCQVKPMCFYARKSPIQFGFMPWSFIFKYEGQSSPVKSSQVKPMCIYARKSASEITAIDNNWIAGSNPGYILEVRSVSIETDVLLCKKVSHSIWFYAMEFHILYLGGLICVKSKILH
uniref:Uncharacterized protein n=1 Tax=Daphnia galeata TaxID=27404 RepID=A0A8J2WNT5_9CRUS|nr:unnamed protein product [Daphnia galeata]